MRIGIFVLAAGRRAGGPEVYETELIRSLAALDGKNQYFVYCTEPSAVDAIGVEQPNITYRVLRPSSRWISVSLSLPALLLRDRIDLLHCTYAPPPWSPVPYVFTMHCLSNLLHPEFYPKAKVLRLNQLQVRALRQAKRILCVSDFVRQGTRDTFHVPSERMDLVYNGVAPHFRPVAGARQLVASRWGIHEPYLLFVGKLQARKNIVRLVQAYARFRQITGSTARLLLVGKRTETSEGIEEAIESSGVRKSVSHIDYIDSQNRSSGEDHPLAVLYSGAEMFVFPSLYEGFGIPVIEAMACGTPVIASDTTSLPEVAGGAALTVAPESVESIAEGMGLLFRSPRLRESLVEKGFRRARQFSWANCAGRTHEVYMRFQMEPVKESSYA